MDDVRLSTEQLVMAAIAEYSRKVAAGGKVQQIGRLGIESEGSNEAKEEGSDAG